MEFFDAVLCTFCGGTLVGDCVEPPVWSRLSNLKLMMESVHMMFPESSAVAASLV